MRVSVVVPVYDPGPYIAGLLESLRAQTLDPAEFEVLFVDDGSTDGTPALLDRAAEETPGFRVIRIPNSGWPGRPRNVGLDAARGDYVFFSDHDDRFDPHALERLTGFAAQHDSDVVVGRIVGVGRSAPERIFERTLVDAQEDLPLLMSSLTPQKLYRRAFLVERGIRFPEGRRRLEDHLFVTKAYLRAARVSVYADHPVYYFVLRDDGANASRRRIEWPGYFANAAESIAVVDAEAPDEATRIAVRSRWLRTETIARLRGKRLLRLDQRDELLAASAAFLREHYPVAEIDLLSPAERLIGRLLLDGRTDDVIALAAWEAAISLRVEVVAAAITGTGLLEARLLARPHADDPLPPVLADLPAGAPTAAELESLLRLPKGARLTARLRSADGATAEVAVEQTVEDGLLAARVSFDLRGAPPLAEGPWRLRVTVRGLGSPRTESPLVPWDARAAIAAGPARVGVLRCSLTVGAQQRLVLRVERAGPAAALLRTAGSARRQARRVLAAVRRRLPG